MFGGQTRCIVGEKEKGVISKGMGKCPASSFASVVKKLKWHLEHDNFTSFTNPATPMFEK